MLVIKGRDAAVATASEVRRNLRKMFEQARTTRVYVTNDGELVGGIISPEMMEILDEVLADRAAGEIAAERLAAIRSGEARLVDENEFWNRAGVES